MPFVERHSESQSQDHCIGIYNVLLLTAHSRCLGFSPLVPDFLSHTHGATKPKLKRPQKLGFLANSKIFGQLQCEYLRQKIWGEGFIGTLRLDFNSQIRLLVTYGEE